MKLILLHISICLATVMIIFAGGSVAHATSDGQEARRIMAQALDQQSHSSFTAEVEMTLIDQGGGERVRRMKVFSKLEGQVSKRAVFFVSPPDIRGTSFLSISNQNPGSGPDQTEQWIYLPALHKIKRIAAGDANQSFMGSDLNYGDMARRGLDGFKYRLLREDQVRGHPAWLIEAIPKTDELAQRAGYSKAVYLVRQDNKTIVRAVNWLLIGNRMRYLDVLNLTKVNDTWTPLEVHVWTAAGKKVLHKTILRNNAVAINQKLPEDIFTKQRLERGF